MTKDEDEESMEGDDNDSTSQQANVDSRGIDLQLENDLIQTLVNLGRSTNDAKTMLNSATALAHMTEVLQCNQTVASDLAIEFMMMMLKDTKNPMSHR